MERMHILVEGRVQGVGFRYFVKTKAVLHGLDGYVRNLDNGMVEMEVQGPEDKIEGFIRDIRNGGNMFIRVDRLSSKRIDSRQESGFTIRY